MSMFPNGNGQHLNAIGASGLLLVGAALLAMCTWPLGALLLVARAVLLYVGVLAVCVALGALFAMASNAKDERAQPK